MNFVISVLILGMLVFGYSFLPWYADSLIAFVAAVYFGLKAYRNNKKNESTKQWIWSGLSFVLGLTIVLIQFGII